MKQICLFSIIIGLIVCISSCEKNSNDENIFYAKVNCDGANFSLIENSGTIKAGINYDSDPDDFSFGGGLYDDSTFIRGTFPKPIYSFTVIFHNIPFEEIKLGNYDFYKINENQFAEKGVTIRWIEPDAWEKLISNYRLSDEYEKCIEQAVNIGYADNPQKVCEEYKKGYNDFFLSSNIEQIDSYFEITYVETKTFEDWNPNCSPAFFDVEELVIEGKTKCLLKSRLDSNITKSITANFRIQVPDYLKRISCNE